MSGMARRIRKFEIFNSIVGLNSIDVMDYLARQEFAPQRALHDRAMLKNPPAIVNRDSTIARGRDAASSLSPPMVRRERVSPPVEFAEMSGAHSMPMNLDFRLALTVRNQAHA